MPRAEQRERCESRVDRSRHRSCARSRPRFPVTGRAHDAAGRRNQRLGRGSRSRRGSKTSESASSSLLDRSEASTSETILPGIAASARRYGFSATFCSGSPSIYGPPVVRKCLFFIISRRSHLRQLTPSVLLIANQSSHVDTPTVLRLSLPPSLRHRVCMAAAADSSTAHDYSDSAFLLTLLLNTVPFSREGARCISS